MAANPAQLLTLYVLGLSAACVAAVALYLLLRSRRPRAVLARGADGRTHLASHRSPLHAPAGRRRALAVLLPLLMLLWVFLGKFLVAPFFPRGADPAPMPQAQSGVVRGASGAQLAVNRYGPPEGPTLLLTHGWGADQGEWRWLMQSLPQGTRVVTWDLPGLGASTPLPGDYTMSAMAADLDAVVASVKGGPVILVGHSIGGMLNLEYAKRYPDRLGKEVRGIVQANTTYTNPVDTKQNPERSRKLQKPVYEPALRVVDAASPAFRALGFLAYQSGLAHLQLASQSFAGMQSWEQLDQTARYAYRSSPRVAARGVLAMLNWDASDVLQRVNVATLIISGEQDVTTLPSASDRMAQEIPSARQVRVSPAAHMGPVEQDRRYAQAMASFVGAMAVARATP
ncbi:MAG TPA: alpha/beta hydrolase [Ramlibacter sp.]|jgi:pimeloyl-ACP methyl ester carboxylesterase|uniref:alpha/beta fold hydrolase n=1 Tax=Ramlibacter sp. TaxID=1917967 RepID=UPI002D32B33E|nr:alpha/beta hydrolase [Ramlibacter sp.]HZY18120.1 alpha/beta hydrolase [Ramlibacter sp.]